MANALGICPLHRLRRSPSPASQGRIAAAPLARPHSSPVQGGGEPPKAVEGADQRIRDFGDMQ